MSSSMDEARLSGAAEGLPPGGLVAVAWSGVALAAFFVSFRCYARLTEARRLFIDDYWILAALFFLITNAILQTLQKNSLYYLAKASAGIVPAGESLLDEGNRYVRYEFTIIGLFWTVVWCVKGAFLSLYWRLFEALPAYRKMWGVVVVFTVLAYVGCWIASVWTCHPPSTYFEFGQCEKPVDIQGSVISISYSTAVDILSDIFIMILPLRLLPSLQVNRRQKIGLASIFGIGLIVIAVAIVRLTQIIGRERADPVGLAVWGLVESTVSVIVGCLPALKTFLSRAVEKTFRRGGTSSGSKTLPGGSRGRAHSQHFGSKSGTRTAEMPMERTYTANSNKESFSSSTRQIVVRTDYGWSREPNSEIRGDVDLHEW